ncbi:MAG: hypothetical protein SAK29_06060 [Scytonema sp. PMC 1069.18]|nr:hypothetical protein [Scytonema sp. PMC 1069.18]MEC4882384.1 hypothetical protein [Scytonema sp. PMC 1070.18]
MVTKITEQILCVADKPHIQQIVTVCRQTFGGWKVYVAKTGAERLVKAQEVKPNAILLDVKMPKIRCDRQTV